MTDDVKLAVLQQNITDMKVDIANLKTEGSSIMRDTVELNVKHNTLEARMVQHSARHEQNYKTLHKDLSDFKSDVLKRLDSMGGRDSVLKILFGAAATAIVIGIVEKVL